MLLPEEFAHLEPHCSLTLSPCDCGVSPCPHEGDGSLKLFMTSLPSRLENTTSDAEKQEIYDNLSSQIKSHKCNENNCHYRELLHSVFPNDTIHTPQPQKKCNVVNLVINFSFSSNILLLMLKIIAFVISRSMSVMASMVDSSLDILSGFVLFIALKMSRKGIQKGTYQDFIHSNQHAKILYSTRYEALGVLAFSCIMSVLALLLFEESIQVIIHIAAGNPPKTDISWAPIMIMIFTIVLKLVLYITALIVSKQYKSPSEALCAYRDDHRNDVLTNSISLCGIWLTKLGGNWNYCDPSVSAGFCLFIFGNWTKNGVEMMKSLAGKQECGEEIAKRITTSCVKSSLIQRVKRIVCYSQGGLKQAELIIGVNDDMRVDVSHDIAQEIQDQVEAMDGVERCFVHIEGMKEESMLETSELS